MNRRQAVTQLCLGIVSVALSACNPSGGAVKPPVSPSASPANPGELVKTSWVLVSMGPVVSPQPVVTGSKVTLQFVDQEKAGGSGGCNSYGGSYQAQAGTITFSQLVQTEMACLDQAVTNQEQQYLTALAAATRYEFTGGRLTIFYADGQSALQFAPP